MLSRKLKADVWSQGVDRAVLSGSFPGEDFSLPLPNLQRLLAILDHP